MSGLRNCKAAGMRVVVEGRQAHYHWLTTLHSQTKTQSYGAMSCRLQRPSMMAMLELHTSRTAYGTMVCTFFPPRAGLCIQGCTMLVS